MPNDSKQPQNHQPQNPASYMYAPVTKKGRCGQCQGSKSKGLWNLQVFARTKKHLEVLVDWRNPVWARQCQRKLLPAIYACTKPIVSDNRTQAPIEKKKQNDTVIIVTYMQNSHLLVSLIEIFILSYTDSMSKEQQIPMSWCWTRKKNDSCSQHTDKVCACIWSHTVCNNLCYSLNGRHTYYSIAFLHSLHKEPKVTMPVSNQRSQALIPMCT